MAYVRRREKKWLVLASTRDRRRPSRRQGGLSRGAGDARAPRSGGGAAGGAVASTPWPCLAVTAHRICLRLALAKVLRRRGTGTDEEAAHSRASRDALALLLADADTPISLSMETDGIHVWLEDSAGQRFVIE